MSTSLVAVVMGSTSDLSIMTEATKLLAEFGVSADEKVMSAHRHPDAVRDFARLAKTNGTEVIIAGAGRAAHLPGVIASMTTLPVIGVPIAGKQLGGLDALLSIVQMPSGVPVATVGIDTAKNAAILAAQILALKHPEVDQKLTAYKEKMAGGTAEPKAEPEVEGEETADWPIIDG